jgi:hypothetical protein
MGLLQRLGFRALGPQIVQKLAQPQIRPLRQPGTEEHQGQRQITYLLAEAIRPLRFGLQTLRADVSSLEGQQLQRGLTPQEGQIDRLSAGGGGLPLGEQSPETGRKAREQLLFGGVTLRIAPLVIKDQ